MERRLIYIYPHNSSFVRKDKEIFNTQFEVSEFEFAVSHKWLTPWFLFKELLFLIRFIPKSKFIIIQFGGYHSFIPILFGRLFNISSAIVLGGTDCVSFPSINYGNLRKNPLKWFTLKSLRYASVLIPASRALVEYDYSYQKIDYPKQGYKYFDPNNNTPYKIISNGISVVKFRLVTGVTRKPKSFITVCTNLDKRNYQLKGIDLYLKAAALFPESDFIVIGKPVPGFKLEVTSNVKHIEFVQNDDLPAILSSCTFYCQFSLSEGFGVALIEAMSCGCIPLVSKVGILDYIIGNSGFVLERRDESLMIKVIEMALRSDVEALSAAARQRVVDEFTDERRKAELLQLIDSLA
jgi:glycosyltransferase involved in cell wall biosynthesis